MKKRNFTLFYQYLLTYILILIIPVVILGAFIYYNMVVELQQNIRDTNHVTTEQITSILDSQFKSLSNIASKINIDPELTPYMLSHNVSSMQQGFRKINSYRDADIVEDIYLYFDNSQKLYSSDGTNYVLEMGTAFYNSINIDEKEFYRIITQSNSNYIQSFSLDEYNVDTPFLLYTHKLKNNIGYNYGSVTFVLKKSVLLELLNNVTNTITSSIAIVDQNNKFICLDNSLSIEHWDLNQIELQSQKDGIYEHAYDNQKYLIASAVSQNYSFKLLTLSPTDIAYNELKYNPLIIIFLCFGLMLFLVFLSILFSKRQSKKIKILSDFAKEKFFNNTPDCKNELESLQLSMMAADNYINNMFQEYDTIKNENSELYIQNYIEGKISDGTKLQKFLNETKLFRHHEKYFVLNILLKNDSWLIKENLMLKIQAGLCEFDLDIHFTNIQNEDVLAILIGRRNNQDIQKDIVDIIADTLSAQIGKNICIGIGQEYDNPQKLPQSFVEALISLKISKNTETVVYYTFQSNNNWWYPDNELLLLNEYVLQRNSQKVLEVVDSIQALFEKKILYPTARQCIISEISNTIIRLALKCNAPIPFEQIDRLIFAKDDYFDILKNLLLGIISSYEQLYSKQQKDTTAKILQFINDNYTDCNFSMDVLAVEFNVSLSYLNRFFRENTGDTFANYLSSKRVERFKQDLIHTNTSIKELVSNIGYIDHSNFTRKFKNLTGLTPAQYRSKNQISKTMKNQ